MQKGQFDPVFVVVLVFLLGMVIANTSMSNLTSTAGWSAIFPAGDRALSLTANERRKAICSSLGVGIFESANFPDESKELLLNEISTGGDFQKYALIANCYLGGLFGTGVGPCAFVDPEGTKCPSWTVYDASTSKRQYLGYMNDNAPCHDLAGTTEIPCTNTKGGFLCNNQPWQCFTIFGALPFAVIYFFLMDILGFASFFSSTTRKVIALGVAAISTMSGGLAGISVQLNEISGIGAGGSFITLVFSLGLITALLGQFTQTMQAAAQARVAKYELTEGFDTMRDIGRRMK